MNKHGVGLAADSALSVGDGQKVYRTAEKLFKIADAPIAIMAYGCAEIMGVPWEIVIKSYVRQLGERRFPAAEQYGEDFLRFVEASDMLFPASAQRDWFRRVIESVWKTDIREPWRKKLEGAPRRNPRKAAALLLQTIKEELAGFRGVAAIEQLGQAYGEQIVSEYAEVLQELETRLFHDVHLTDEIRDALRRLVKLMHTHQWFHPDNVSGLVVAGFGEAELFPSLYIYSAGTVVASRLRWLKVDEAHVDREHPVIIIPFAQTDMIDLFCTGIYPALKERLVDIIVKMPAAAKRRAQSWRTRAKGREIPTGAGAGDRQDRRSNHREGVSGEIHAPADQLGGRAVTLRARENGGGARQSHRVQGAHVVAAAGDRGRPHRRRGDLQGRRLRLGETEEHSQAGGRRDLPDALRRRPGGGPGGVFGFVPPSQGGAGLLLEVFSQRYE